MPKHLKSCSLLVVVVFITHCLETTSAATAAISTGAVRDPPTIDMTGKRFNYVLTDGEPVEATSSAGKFENYRNSPKMFRLCGRVRQVHIMHVSEHLHKRYDCGMPIE